MKTKIDSELFKRIKSRMINKACKVKNFDKVIEVPLYNHAGLNYPALFDELLVDILEIQPSESVLDIGGGHNPFKRADVITDAFLHESTHRMGKSLLSDKKYVEAKIENLPFKDKEFDFVFSRHVLEHADDPAKACKEMMRVGKRGFWEAPVKWYEYFLGHPTHKWLIEYIDGVVRFERKPYVENPFKYALYKMWTEDEDFNLRIEVNFRNLAFVQIYWEDSFNYKVIDNKLPEIYGYNDDDTMKVESTLDYAFNLIRQKSPAVRAVPELEKILEKEPDNETAQKYYLRVTGKSYIDTNKPKSESDKWKDLSENTISDNYGNVMRLGPLEKGNDFEKKHKQENIYMLYEEYTELHYIKEYMNIVKDYSHGGKILEAGCEAAYCSIYLSSDTSSYAFDNSDDLIKEAEKNKERLNSDIHIYKGSPFDEKSYKDAPYDVIFHNRLMNRLDDSKIKGLLDLQLKYCKYIIFTAPSIFFAYRKFEDARLMELAQWEIILSDYNIIELMYVRAPQWELNKREHIIAVIKGDIPADDKKNIQVAWEGPLTGNHTDTIVNKRICKKLADKNFINLRIISNEIIKPSDEKQLDETIVKLTHNPLLNSPDIHIRHFSPPNFDKPPKGVFIFMHPLKFCNIPTKWIQPIKIFVDEVWTYSSYHKELYINSGIDENKIFNITPGIDPTVFNPNAKPMKLNTGKIFKFLFVGESLESKAMDIILDAYCELFSCDDDVCLVIKDLFYPPHSPTIANAIQNITKDKTKPEILYIKEDSYTDFEMHGLYKACDCFVFPYRREYFSLHLTEAMACGLPVIVTADGACMDFCNDANSYLIKLAITDIKESSNIYEIYKDSLKKQMLYVYNHRQEAENKGKVASDFINSNFTWENTADKIYDRILKLQSEKDLKLQKQYNIDDNLAKGIEFFNKNDLDEAAGCFQKVLDIKPDNSDSLYNLGIIYIRKKDYGKAVEILKKCIKAGNLSSDIYSALGMALDGMGMKDMSSKFFAKAKELEKNV